jgi:protein ImuB
MVVAEPSLRKTHLVLFRRDPRRGQRVSAASPLARCDGVELDMPIVEVKQLLRRAGKRPPAYQPTHRLHPRTQHRQLAKHAVEAACSGGVAKELSSADDRSGKQKPPLPQLESQPWYLIEHDPIADRKSLESLADSLHCFSPIVGVEQTENPESCLLDVTGLANLFGGEAGLQKKVIRFLADQGYVVFSSIADSVGMAWGLAHYHSSAAPGQKLDHDPGQNHLALGASDWETFARLPVSALRLSLETAETLNRLGIERVEQVLKIPRAHLTSRFGNEVSRQVDQAMGRIEEPVIARHRPADFEATQFIEFPTRDRETIGVILSRLLQQICDQLATNQQGALQWQVQLDCVDSPSLEFEVNLFQPTATVSHVLQLMELQLESVLKPHLRRKRSSVKNKTATQRRAMLRSVTNVLVQGISVRVTSCVLLVQRQRELFDESPRLDKQELTHLINHLTSRLGQESIVYPVLQSGAQPEFSFRMKPLVDPKRMRSRKHATAKDFSHRMARPFRLLEEVVEIGVGAGGVADEPEVVPESFAYQSLRHQVLQAWGPERIETGWWRGPTARRDYWRIETNQGQHFWVYFDLRRKRWFLQGEF